MRIYKPKSQPSRSLMHGEETPRTFGPKRDAYIIAPRRNVSMEATPYEYPMFTPTEQSKGSKIQMDANTVFIGDRPDRSQVDQMRGQLRRAMFGEYTRADWYRMLATDSEYTAFLNSLVGRLNSLVSTWDETMGVSNVAIGNAVNNGVTPLRYMDLPEMADVRKDLNNAYEMVNQGWVSLKNHQQFWSDVWDRAHAINTAVVATSAAVVGGVAAYKLGSSLLGPGAFSATPGVQQLPSLTPFTLERGVPNVLERAFMDAGFSPGFWRAFKKQAKRKAKTWRILIRDPKKKRHSAVSSFGRTEFMMNDAQCDPMLDAALESQIYETGLLQDAYDLKPGSLESRMVGDMFDLDTFRNPTAHRTFYSVWKKIKKFAKKVIGFAAPFIPGVGGAIAGMIGGGGGSQAPQQQQQQQLEQGGAAEPPAPTPGGGSWTEMLGGLARQWIESKLKKGQVQPGAATRFGTPLGTFAIMNGQMRVIPITGIGEKKKQAESLLNAFLSDPSLQASRPEGYPFITSFKQGYIIPLADERSIGIGSTSGREVIPYLSERPYALNAPGNAMDVDCGHMFDRHGALPPTGEFYKSSLLVARLSDLPKHVYGQIRIGEMPFTIDINRNSVNSRAKISFVHETLHAITEMLKLGLSHEQLHALSVFVTSEVLPGYLALETKLGN